MHKSDFQTWTFFLLSVFVLGGTLLAMGRFQVESQFDSKSYEDFPFDSLVSALNHQRTFAYPALLRAVEFLNESNAIVPLFQFAFAVWSTGFWMQTLKQLGWDAWLALAAALPILTSTLVTNYSHLLTPDLMTQSLSVIVVSLWLRCVYQRSGWLVYVILSIAIFLCYQTKPSYLFLIGFVPVGGAIAAWWLFNEQLGAWRIGLQLSLASLVPFLSWCALRWYYVGHFGLVSFGGYNVIGIAGQLLDRDVAAKLSSDIQPLAIDILDRREENKSWETRYRYSVFESQYNPMVWELAVPAASQRYDHDSRRMNFALSKLSKEIILQRPTGYAIWLVLAAEHSIVESVVLIVRNPCVLIAVGLILFGHARFWQKQTVNRKSSESNEIDTCQSSVYPHGIVYQTIVWLSLGYAFCSLMLVILVEAPIARYCAPATVFVPSFICMLAVDTLRRAKHA